MAEATAKRVLVSRQRKKFGEFSSSELSRTQRLEKGLRPWGGSKFRKDEWALLTEKEREHILQKSREHIARQQCIGVPLQDMYGPELVLNFRTYGLDEPARWMERATTTVTIND